MNFYRYRIQKQYFRPYTNLLKEAVKNWEILELLVKKENIKFVVENFLGI